MAKEPKSFGRAELAAKVMDDCGLSRRKSVAVVNAVLEWMICQLCRGRTVEFPYGELRRVRKYFGESWESDDDWPANREGYTIVYEEVPPWSRKRKGGNRPPEKIRFRARKGW